MAESGGATKILPFLIGLAICWLIFNPPAAIRAIGGAGYLVAIAIVLLAILGLVFFAILKNLPEEISMMPDASSSMPPEMTRLNQELTGLGFTQASNEPLRVDLSPPALMMPFVHEAERVYATVFKTGSTPPIISYDFVSYLDGVRGSLTTSANWQGGVLPGPEGALKQNFVGLGPSVLFERHKQGLAYLKGKGFSCRSLSKQSFFTDFRASFQKMRQSFLASPVSGTISALVRTITKKTPHMGAIQNQPMAQKQISKMSGIAKPIG